MKLGRPVGGAKNLKLDKHADKIDGYLAKGINKVAIAKLLDVSPNTLYEWLKVRRPGSTPASLATLQPSRTFGCGFLGLHQFRHHRPQPTQPHVDRNAQLKLPSSLS
jgi:hypothetical protein